MAKTYPELIEDLESYNERTKTATQTYEASLPDILTAVTHTEQDASSTSQDRQVVEAARTEVESNTTIASDAAVTAEEKAQIATTKAQEVSDDADQVAQDRQAIEDIADSVMRYEGLWPDTGGSALKGDTYQTQVGGTPTGQYFTALQDTTVDPVGDDVNWREIITSTQMTADYLSRDDGDFYNRGGVMVERDSIYTIGNGSYSWWCEPNVNQLSELVPFVSVGCVGQSSQRVHFNSPTDNIRGTKTAHMAVNNLGDVGYEGDEHNSPVTFMIDGNIHTFFAGHADDGKIWMSRGVGIDPNTLSRPEVIYDDPDGATSYVQLLKAGDGVYLFYRSTPTKWKLLFTTDSGVTWNPRNLIESAGTQQLYFRATTTGTLGGSIRIVALYHPNFRGENRIWTATINTGTRKVSLTGGIEVGDISLPDNTPTITTDMMEVFANIGERRTRLFDIQYSTSSTLKMLIADFPKNGWDGEYRYLEYDYATETLTKNAYICDSGNFISDGYHAGCSFMDVEYGIGNPTPKPIYSIRESSGSYILEEYSSSDTGVTWYLNRTIRTKSDGTKMWRPKKPFNQRYKQSYQQIDVIWNEGEYTSYTDYDSQIMAKLSVANPL